MKLKPHLITASCVLFCLTLSVIRTSAYQAVNSDQQQPVIDINAGGLVVGGPYGQFLAQVFTVGKRTPLTGVQIPISCDSDFYGVIIVEIQGVTDGLPNGIIEGSRTIPTAPFYFAPPIFHSLNLSPPVSHLMVGQQYAIVLQTTGTCTVFQGPEGNPYSGGSAYYKDLLNSSWQPIGLRDDLPFVTLVKGR